MGAEAPIFVNTEVIIMMWHRVIKQDWGKVIDFVDHFELEHTEALKEIQIKGSLEKLAAEMPGIVEYRYRQLQEIEAVLQYFENELKKVRSEKFKMFLEKYQRALSSTDAWKYTDGDAEVCDLCDLINEVALVRNKFTAVFKGLEQKSWMLGHVVRLRAVGIEDCTL